MHATRTGRLQARPRFSISSALFAGILLALVSACAQGPDRTTPWELHPPEAAPEAVAPPEDPAWEAREQPVREAVFRDLVRRSRWTFERFGWEQGAMPWFLRLEGGEDPSESLLTNLADLGLTLRKGSACHIPGAVEDRETGERGVLLRLRSLEWNPDGSALVKGDFVFGNRGGSGWNLRVEQGEAGWTVEEAKNEKGGVTRRRF